MALFGKKVTPVQTTCNCGHCAPQASEQPTQPTEGPSVKVLGSGCAKCNQLEAATKAALEELHMDTAIDHVTDFTKIAAYGVMSTPALVVDGKVVSYGKVLRQDEVVALLRKVRG
ncbi:MAG TPA: thioredoxin family protein [Candidatus Limiplasma sp.]|nr:thioredoxin family protein [Candidatus Limiplasma sp.]HPS80632.1 thioredoxin family protein [Candidatus Limiplasma sp.]